MPNFQNVLEVDASLEDHWNWYNSDGAFRRIMPDWEGLEPIQVGKIADGEMTIFPVQMGPIKKKWVARHENVRPLYGFDDTSLKGPFAKWDHSREFKQENGKTIAIDSVEYKLPVHFATGWTKKFTVIPRVKAMFGFRNRRVEMDLKRIPSQKMRVLISGSTGLIGKQLCAFYACMGHEVHRLVRPSTKLPADANKENVVKWDDQKGEILEGSLEGFDCIIHLAGAGIGDKRWSKARKELIETSRTIPTKNLADLICGLENKPSVFIQGSAIGFYGDRQDEILDEDSIIGEGYLPQTCKKWEDASLELESHGIRRVVIRTGIVMTCLGGALGKQLFPAKMGALGPVGGGKQFQSWISLDDQIHAIQHLMLNDDCNGVYNLVSPNPTTQKKFAKVLGKIFFRPSFAPLPKFMVKILFGEMGEKLLLESQRVSPKRLLESGYEFNHPDLENALRHRTGKVR